MDTSYVSSLTKNELAEELRRRGVDIGPITPFTRKVYEIKLMKLLYGNDAAVSPSKYPPVDEDDDTESEEDIVETVQTRSTQNPVRVPKALVGQTEMRKRPIPIISPARNPKFEGAGDRIRPLPRRTPPGTASSSPVTTTTKKGIPLWVKLSVFIVLLVFAFLVIKNMESNAENSIPREIEAEV